MARECRKMCGDIGLPSKLGAADLARAGRSPHDVRRSEARQALVVGTDEDRLRLVMGEPAFFQQFRQ